jgi:prefoldin subunit 5
VPSSELQQTIAQLRAQLLAIEPDVEELEDAIAAIEEPGGRMLRSGRCSCLPGVG